MVSLQVSRPWARIGLAGGSLACLLVSLTAHADPPIRPLRISARDDFMLRRSDGRLEGIVTAVSLKRSLFTMRVDAVSPPGSRRHVLSQATNATVLFDGPSLLVMGDKPDRGMGLDELGMGSRVLVVGSDTTVRPAALAARVIVIQRLVAGPGWLPDSPAEQSSTTIKPNLPPSIRDKYPPGY